MITKNKRGGKRPGSGRKTTDPTVPVTSYVPMSKLSTFEGSDVKEQRMQCRAFFAESLEKRAKSLAR